MRGAATASFCVFALLATACSQSAEDQTAPQSASVSREPGAAAVAALDRAGRRPPPALRRASPEEVEARFTRIGQARESARALAARPENLDELLARLGSSSQRVERSVLVNRYLKAANAMNAAERPAAIARLQEVIDATRPSSASR
jgi:hypothetical protein